MSASPEPAVEELARGGDAYARRAWREAYELLSEADGTASLAPACSPRRRCRGVTAGEQILVWNGLAVPLPVLTVRPGSFGELAAAVRFAVDLGLPLAFAGDGRCKDAERALTLDLSAPRPVPENRAERDDD